MVCDTMKRVCLVGVAIALWSHAQAQPVSPGPRPVCPPDSALSCVVNVFSDEEYRFNINGRYVTYKFIDHGIFNLHCSSAIYLDDPALPRFNPVLRVHTVQLKQCWPHDTSYAAALRSLNVTALDDMPSLNGELASPSYFIQLELYKINNFNLNLLASIPTLRNLTIQRDNFTNADLALLPAGLERLVIWSSEITHVAMDALARLPDLSELQVKSSANLRVETAGNLSVLYISSLGTTLVDLSLPDTLQLLDIKAWATRHPKPWRSCAGLKSLLIFISVTESLPDGWLGRCTRLRKLRMAAGQKLTSLPAGVLRGAIALEVVDFEQCALTELPEGLLSDAKLLRELNLSDNHLHTLSGDLFRSLKSLNKLELSFNNLSSRVLEVLGGITSLNTLNLDYNDALDACTELNGMQGSPLRDLKNLKALILPGTATRRVCPDWRQLPRLQELDISDTAITMLNYTDLQFNITMSMILRMSKVNISLHRKDYESIATAAASQLLTPLKLYATQRLPCDCGLYWAAAVMRLPNSYLQDDNIRCKDTRLLHDVPLDELVCPAPGTCPAGCKCGMREDATRPGLVLRVHCAGAKLLRVPRIDTKATLQSKGPEPVTLEMRLANNFINLIEPEDLPPELTVLDLSNNGLDRIYPATARELASRPNLCVWLADNPLECDCRAAPVLAIIRAHPDVFCDSTYSNTTCSDDTALREAIPVLCDDGITTEPGNITGGNLDDTTETVPQFTKQQVHQSVPERDSENVSKSMSTGTTIAWALGAAVAGAVVAIALGLFLLQRRRRQRAATQTRPQPQDGVEWPYDAFVSFAHADEAVVRELVERLESGPTPLRLCVHYRDWVPGGWIPSQIAASVRVSRRTVAIVSSAFLRSKWTRAEFREAYAAAMENNEPRLVLVLLEDPLQLPLDAELRTFITTNTYVRWGDPWFWQKLRCALPTPAPRPPLAVKAPGALPNPSPEPAQIPENV